MPYTFAASFLFFTPGNRVYGSINQVGCIYDIVYGATSDVRCIHNRLRMSAHTFAGAND